LLGLGAALAASGVLLFVPPSGASTAPPGPVTAAIAWPRAQRGVLSADLPDGTAYQPGIFLDAHTSVGTATSRDGKFTRLVLVGARQTVRQLRRVPSAENPSFQTFAVAGDVLVWAEGTARGGTQMWKVNLRDGRPAQKLTSDTGSAAFYHSQYDLVVNAGRLYWVASRNDDVTEVRSVALTGGPVQTRAVPGDWQLSAWPWLVNGITAATGTTLLRNLNTDRNLAISGTGSRSTTQCSPLWCQVVTLSRDGYNRIDLMHPDGDRRPRAAGPFPGVLPDRPGFRPDRQHPTARLRNSLAPNRRSESGRGPGLLSQRRALLGDGQSGHLHLAHRRPADHLTDPPFRGIEGCTIADAWH
jgi:hypothetical protein